LTPGIDKVKSLESLRALMGVISLSEGHAKAALHTTIEKGITASISKVYVLLNSFNSCQPR